MKKIEAITDPPALDAIKRHLAEAGIDGRLIVTEASGLENLGRFYQHETTAENPWKPCLRIDLIVSDRQTESAVDIILRQAKLAGGRGTGGYIDFSRWMPPWRLAPKSFINLPRTVGSEDQNFHEPPART
jgi:nitrogen regulatory protein PII